MVISIKIKVLFLLIFCALLLPGIAMAQTPKLPLIFEGDVTIDGYDAPVGTVIVAEVEGVEVASTAITKEIEIGQYILTVQNEGYTGKTVVFKVDGILAGEHEYVSSMDPIVNFDLHMQTIPPASATDDSSDTDNTLPGKAVAFLSGLFGLGTKAIIGIVVGVMALITVILLLAIIRRRRFYI